MSTFHLFPNLPTEIRLLIWNHSVRDPTRIVHVGQKKYSTQCWGWTKEQGQCPKAIFSATPEPAILHVNDEARSVGEAYYTKAFCCPLHQSLSYRADHCVWLNFDTDIVEMSLMDIYRKKRHADFDKIQRLVVTSDDDKAGQFYEFGPRYLDFKDLKSVDILHDGSFYYWRMSLAGYAPWGCEPRIIRIIQTSTGEVLDYDRDEQLCEQYRSNVCLDSCTHIGAHNWDWITEERGDWYARCFGDI